MVFRKTGSVKLHFLFFLPALIATISCRGPDQVVTASEQRVVHPIPELIPRFDEAHDFVSPSGDLEGDENAQAITQALLSLTELFTLGVLQGAQYEQLGPILDIQEGPASNIYVLDGQYNEVKVYSSEGNFLYAVEGPSEEEPLDVHRRGSSSRVFFPASLEVDSSGRIFFADRVEGIKIFERAGETHQLSTILSPSLEIHEVCVKKDVLHVHGFSPSNSHAINRLSLSGNTLNSFGAIYSSSSPLVYRVLGMGQIACMDSSIVYAPNFLPVIYSYSLKGDVRWVIRIPDFETLEIIEKGSEVSMDVFTKPHDQVVRVVPLPEAYVIVQIASFTPESLSISKRGKGEGYAALRTYLMSTQTGNAIFVGDTVPQIYTATEGHLYTARRHPFPQISVLSFRGKH